MGRTQGDDGVGAEADLSCFRFERGEIPVDILLAGEKGRVIGGEVVRVVAADKRVLPLLNLRS